MLRWGRFYGGGVLWYRMGFVEVIWSGRVGFVEVTCLGRVGFVKVTWFRIGRV